MAGKLQPQLCSANLLRLAKGCQWYIVNSAICKNAARYVFLHVLILRVDLAHAIHSACHVH